MYKICLGYFTKSTTDPETTYQRESEFEIQLCHRVKQMTAWKIMTEFSAEQIVRKCIHYRRNVYANIFFTLAYSGRSRYRKTIREPNKAKNYMTKKEYLHTEPFLLSIINNYKVDIITCAKSLQ